MPSTTSTTAATTKAAKAVRLGDFVEYQDSQGLTKLALVIGTRKSIDEDRGQGGVSRPDKGSAHLTVFGPTGSRYTRHNVPEGDGANTFARR